MSLLKVLGLDLKIFLAQLINFSVLVFVLWRFAYQPIFKILEDRRKKVAQGVADAEKATQELAQAKTEAEKIIFETKKEALVLLEKASLEAEEKKEAIVAKAQDEIKEVIKIEKERFVIEKNKALEEAKKELANLVLLALEKLLPEKIDQKADSELAQKIVKNMK